MKINKCYHCMLDIPEGAQVCPHCGKTLDFQSVSPTTLRPYTILNNKYLVGGVLGQGGFGITYVGFDLALERKVAIKEFYPRGQATRVSGTSTLMWDTGENSIQLHKTGMESFVKEARKMARVEVIPEVAGVRDCFYQNGTAYIVMEFVEGQTLQKYLQQHGALTWEEANPLFSAVINAMEKLHREGIIHRDLSPDNLMLLPDGRIKILDLGAAKDLGSGGASSQLVVRSGFSPLEQYGSRGSSGPQTDVYALAATMYYSLTGKVPTNALDRMSEDDLNWDLPQLRALPEQVRQALRHAMALNMTQRTQSMADLRQELGSATIPQGGNRKKSQKKQPPRESKSRNTVASLVIAAAAVLMLAVLAVAYKTVHVWQPATCNAPSTCKICGKTQGVTLEHVWKAATYDDPKTCTLCGETKGLPIAYAPIAAGVFHTVGLKSDGTVVAAGDTGSHRCDVGSWQDIVAISAGFFHTVGLKSGGTVVATGSNGEGQCNVSTWRDIVAVAAGDKHTVGLKSDGTVVAVGYNSNGQCKVSAWRDIVAIAAGENHTVGLKSDGTVVATGSNGEGQCDVSTWRDIVAIAAGEEHTVGLKSDGTVVAVGYDSGGQCDVSAWRDIVAISAGWLHTVGLKSDGTVVAVGKNADGQCNVKTWQNIVAVAARWVHTVGLKSDGTVVAVGENDYGECKVSAWRSIGR